MNFFFCLNVTDQIKEENDTRDAVRGSKSTHKLGSKLENDAIPLSMPLLVPMWLFDIMCNIRIFPLQLIVKKLQKKLG